MKGTDGWTPVLVGLGANVGDRRANVEEAVARIGREKTVRWRCVSGLRETEAQGGPPQEPFLNGVGELVTCLSPRALLCLLKRIEVALGRVRTVHHGPRPIDLDILTYGDLSIESEDLVIPHPRLLERSFVLEPLVEIVPERTHPLTGRTFRQHLEDLRSRERAAAAPGDAE
jgi:2-amino-4-hydroxy-6-hydroxymethyldihydropteridine diphosphokinase